MAVVEKVREAWRRRQETKVAPSVIEETTRAGTVGAAPPLTRPEAQTRMHREVWLLAWPSVLTMMLQSLNMLIDRGFVGRLGPDALAAVGVGGQLMFLLFSIGMSISVGTTALVARFTGTRETDEARVAANQSLWVAGAAAIFCMALMLPLRAQIVHLLGVDARASHLALDFITVRIVSIPITFALSIFLAVYRGLGDTRTPLFVMGAANVIHLLGDWLILLGNAGFPRLGLTGGALALTISEAVAIAVFAWHVRHTAVHGMLTRKKRLHWGWATRILNIGFPAAVQNVSRVLSMLAFTSVLARTSDATAAVAALTIGLTSESIAFMPGFAFSMAAATLTGQSLGAKNPDRAEQSAWAALWQGLAIMALMGVVFYVFAPQFAHFFTKDPQVHALAVAYLRISALAEPFLALGMILTGALNGAGDTRAPALVSVLTMWGVRLPLAFLAAHTWGFGAHGAWWAMAASTAVGGIAAVALFKWGRWKRATV